MMKKIVFVFVVSFLIGSAEESFSQQNTAELESRVQALENFSQTIPPTLNEFSSTLENGINNYTQTLENNLQNFSQRLSAEVERRISQLEGGRVVLDPFSRAFQKIDSNVGTFLIAVQKIDSTAAGYKLTLNIGNPYNADFRDFSVKLLWANKSDVTSKGGAAAMNGMEYNFQGILKKGSWNPFEVEIIAESKQLYIECELYVAGAELEQL
jgi:hypothetical protein